jgi:hypothetical protein
VPTREGVCVINTNEELCTPAASLPGATTLDLCSPTLPTGKLEIEWLLPDRVTHVTPGMSNGTKVNFVSGAKSSEMVPDPRRGYFREVR